MSDWSEHIDAMKEDLERPLWRAVRERIEKDMRIADSQCRDVNLSEVNRLSAAHNWHALNDLLALPGKIIEKAETPNG